MFWMFPAAGALAGGLLNKKDPLKGALLGAGLGAAGGMAAPGLLGGAAGAGSAAGSVGTAGGLLSAPTTLSAAGGSLPTGAFLGEGVASGIPAWDAAASGGLFGQLKTAGEAIQPFANAAGAAGQVSGMFQDQEQPIQPAQMQQATGGSQTLAALAQQGTQQMQSELQAAEQKRRQRRQGLLGVA